MRDAILYKMNILTEQADMNSNKNEVIDLQDNSKDRISNDKVKERRHKQDTEDIKSNDYNDEFPVDSKSHKHHNTERTNRDNNREHTSGTTAKDVCENEEIEDGQIPSIQLQSTKKRKRNEDDEDEKG